MYGGILGRSKIGTPPVDGSHVLDHFFTKLLALEDLMTTATGRREARDRSEFTGLFLERLELEIAPR